MYNHYANIVHLQLIWIHAVFIVKSPFVVEAWCHIHWLLHTIKLYIVGSFPFLYNKHVYHFSYNLIKLWWCHSHCYVLYIICGLFSFQCYHTSSLWRSLCKLRQPTPYHSLGSKWQNSLYFMYHTSLSRSLCCSHETFGPCCCQICKLIFCIQQYLCA